MIDAACDRGGPVIEDGAGRQLEKPVPSLYLDKDCSFPGT